MSVQWFNSNTLFCCVYNFTPSMTVRTVDFNLHPYNTASFNSVVLIGSASCHQCLLLLVVQVNRMHKCLQDYEQTKLAEFTATLDTGEQGLISHIKKSIAVAVEKYVMWRNRKDKS